MFLSPLSVSSRLLTKYLAYAYVKASAAWITKGSLILFYKVCHKIRKDSNTDVTSIEETEKEPV